MGSSPRLRGTQQPLRQTTTTRGIIPALAGNTSGSRPARSNTWDHPRACGEHRQASPVHVRALGSSPRLRGTLRGRGRCFQCEGDHPRACGEHVLFVGFMGWSAGSSPRLRGTLSPFVVQLHGEGIIPALAGNTHSCSSTRTTWWDHPRACGEHVCDIPAEAFNRGSSPRLRGTQTAVSSFCMSTWIIPALAGNTQHSQHPTPAHWDHPRACGEHNHSSVVSLSMLGSSPRLRGTRAGLHRD